jgi:hypothetical protein
VAGTTGKQAWRPVTGALPGTRYNTLLRTHLSIFKSEPFVKPMSAFELWCIKFFFDVFLPPSSAGEDYYEVLGVNRRAKPEEIRRAYRRLARKCHPDKKQQRDGGYSSSVDAQEFKRLHEAYEVSKCSFSAKSTCAPKLFLLNAAAGIIYTNWSGIDRPKKTKNV